MRPLFIAMPPIHSFLVAVAATLAATLTACVPATTGRDVHNLYVSLEQKGVYVNYCNAYAVGWRSMPTDGGLAGVAFLQEQRNALFATCMMDRGYRKYLLRD